jgi:ribulose-phosphate 3-epimerase
MRRVKIAPSILAYDLGNLRGAVDIATKGGADMVHLDVIDGHFAPNISFGAGTVKALRKSTDLKFDTHLMISEPRRYVQDFLDAGADNLIFQAEVIDKADLDALYAVVNGYGRKMGLALKPGTDLPTWAEERLDRLKTILILTVNPGFSFQKMDTNQFPKIEKISRLVDERGLDIDIEIDGGIDAGNIHEVAKRGGNAFVAGAAVYGQPDPVAAIARLKVNAKVARGAA